MNILRNHHVVMWTFTRLVYVPLVNTHTIKSVGKPSHGHKEMDRLGHNPEQLQPIANLIQDV